MPGENAARSCLYEIKLIFPDVFCVNGVGRNFPFEDTSCSENKYSTYEYNQSVFHL